MLSSGFEAPIGHETWAGRTLRSPAPAFIGFAVHFEIAVVSDLYTLLFHFNLSDAIETQMTLNYAERCAHFSAIFWTIFGQTVLNLIPNPGG